MRGEEDTEHGARVLTFIHATGAEAIKGIFRSGDFRGRSYDQ
jgi:hypothetical protein